MLKLQKIKRLSLLALLIAALPGVALAQDTSTLPDEVVVEREGFFPEGIEWDSVRGRFLLSSIGEGTIFAVQDDGSVTPFIEDEDLMSTIGIHIDAANDRLLVCNNNFAVTQGEVPEGPQAMLMAYDLETGERLFAADLTDLGPGDLHFANDVTVDEEGNAYVTDSFDPVIYKVDPEGSASVLVEDERFAAEGFGLNGIDYHLNGFLLVAKSSDGILFKVPVAEPANVTEVTLDQPIMGADGVVLAENGTLYIVSGSLQQVSHLASEDEWETATTIETAPTSQPATTAALREGEVYVIFAHLSDLGSDTPPAAFEIVRVAFEPMG